MASEETDSLAKAVEALSLNTADTTKVDTDKTTPTRKQPRRKAKEASKKNIQEDTKDITEGTQQAGNNSSEQATATTIQPKRRYIPPHLRAKGTASNTSQTTTGSTNNYNAAPSSTAQHATAFNAHAPAFKPQQRQQKPLKQTKLGPNVTEFTLPLRQSTPKKHLLKRPQPTPAYIGQALKPAQTLDAPRPLLVILDLNGTLLYRKKRGANFTARPNVDKFLQYLFRHHYVMVWSSAKPYNVEGMCDRLFTKEQREQLVAVWARDKLRLPTHAYDLKVQVYKQLSWVWEDQEVQSVLSQDNPPWNQTDTVLIDDSVEKGASEPYNILQLQEFEAAQEQMKNDVLGQVARYLESLRSEKDVSAYMRMQPFRYADGEEVNWKNFVDDV